MIIDINGCKETILTDEDFRYIVSKYLGPEALDYFDSLIDLYEEEISTLGKEISELENCVEELENKLEEKENA